MRFWLGVGRKPGSQHRLYRSRGRIALAPVVGGSRSCLHHLQVNAAPRFAQREDFDFGPSIGGCERMNLQQEPWARDSISVQKNWQCRATPAIRSRSRGSGAQGRSRPGDRQARAGRRSASMSSSDQRAASIRLDEQLSRSRTRRLLRIGLVGTARKIAAGGQSERVPLHHDRQGLPALSFRQIAAVQFELQLLAALRRTPSSHERGPKHAAQALPAKVAPAQRPVGKAVTGRSGKSCAKARSARSSGCSREPLSHSRASRCC